MDVYLINLDRSPERLTEMTRRLAGIDFIRFPAVEGMALPDQSGPLSKGEVACLMSHRSVWSALLASDASCACILEDDALLGDGFRDFVASSEWLPATFDLIKLETFPGPCLLGEAESRYRGRSVHRLRSAHLGSAAYIISRAGAEKALATVQAFDAPVDVAIFGKVAARGLATYQVVPALCRQSPPSTETESTIDVIRPKPPRQRGFDKIVREITRPLDQIRDLTSIDRWRYRRLVIAFR